MPPRGCVLRILGPMFRGLPVRVEYRTGELLLLERRGKGMMMYKALGRMYELLAVGLEAFVMHQRSTQELQKLRLLQLEEKVQTLRALQRACRRAKEEEGSGT